MDRIKLEEIKLFVIGGSAGSVPIISKLVKAIPANYRHTIILVLHRQRNVVSEMAQILTFGNEFVNIIEPDDKEPIQQGGIYLAPQNYHLLVEEDLTFSLDYSEAIKYSRPSIDVTFESVARVFKSRAYAILLSGANNDGAAGLQSVIANGGVGIVQQPATASYTAMPEAAILKNKECLVYNPEQIISFITEAQ